MSAEPLARKWLWHTGWEGPRAFWLGLSRVVRTTNAVVFATVAWGFDDDLPLRRLPHLRVLHTAEVTSTTLNASLALVTTKVHLSWLGLAIGVAHRAKWLVPATLGGGWFYYYGDE